MSEYVSPITPKKLEEASYADIFELMVNQPPRTFSDGTPPVRLSFRDNMALMTATSPDVFLFTTHSAVPVADSVRGYYEELGQRVPELGIIHADSWVSPNPGSTIYNQAFDSELKRLGSDLKGKRVAIIDQYIKRGFTRTMAKAIAREAGALDVISPEGANWYGDAEKEEVYLDAVSSAHALHMQKVGHAAAKH